MMASEKGTRLLKVFKALEAHPIIGISNKEISDGLGISPVHVSRDLEDLIAEGLVTRLDNGNFAYSIKTLQIAERFRRQQEDLERHLAEVLRRTQMY
ncbi:DNA-binding protein [Neisseria brasiliensis]|nr:MULTISPECIES: DNA-binding protein [Neisseria]PJO78213.1 DNA-binding protein [Neisseria sp. N177_16]QGL25025.1 DNA-binding protein [Neisseria brasiliensis]